LQILRIEDPETHEALDLKEITIKTHTKAAENSPTKESTEPKEQVPAKTDSSTQGEEEVQPDFVKDQSESLITDVDKEVSNEESKDKAEVKVCILSTCCCYATIKPACKLFDLSMDVTLRCGHETRQCLATCILKWLWRPEYCLT